MPEDAKSKVLQGPGEVHAAELAPVVHGLPLLLRVAPSAPQHPHKRLLYVTGSQNSFLWGRGFPWIEQR